MEMKTKRSIAGLNLLIFLIMIACLHGYALQAGAQQVVYPTDNYLVDPGKVQAAVNAVPLGGTVILKATDEYGNPKQFDFGQPITWASAGNASNDIRRVVIKKMSKYSVRKTIKAIH
jgi:hypothetical protein